MGLLTRMADSLSPLQNYPNGDDYWYRNRGTSTLSGVQIDADSAKTISAVFACVRVIAESIATLPLNMFERNADGSKMRMHKHPLQETLHSQANPFQTAVEFRELMTALALLRGSAFALIEDTDEATGACDLIPLHPDLMTVRYYGDYGQVRRYFYGMPQVEIPSGNIFHLRGFDGIGIANVARESMALTKATEEYGQRFFGQGQRPIGFLSVPQNDKRVPMNNTTYERVKEQIKEIYSGMKNSHQIAVLEDGVTWQAMGMTAEDSQFLETRRFQIEEIARWFRVPPHKIGHLDKATFSNIEQQSIEFVTDSLRPWLVRWEQTIRRDLIREPGRFFAEHNADALLRGDTTQRYAAYALAIDRGILSPNEVRERENLNPREDQWGSAYNRNLNQTTTADPAVSTVPTDPNAPDPEARAFDFEVRHPVVIAAATRMAERELHAIKSLVPDPSGEITSAWAVTFYAKHADMITESLAIPAAKAKEFCDAQRTRLLLYGREKMCEWTIQIAEELTQIAGHYHKENRK